MLRKKNIILNGNRAIGSEIIHQNDMVNIFISDETIAKFKRDNHKFVSFNNLPNPKLIYEDKNFLIAVKPKGLLSHPNNNERNSLTDIITNYLFKTGDYQQSTFIPAIANRLDKNTTGIVLCGKNLPALQSLNEAIKNKNLHKYYVAIVVGQVKKGNILNDYYIKDKKKNKVIVSSYPQGDQIITEYMPLAVYKKFSFIKLRLITGKPHQLRAHMAFAGYPILGDPKYGNLNYNKWLSENFKIKDQLLHAESIFFKDCSKPLENVKGKTFTAPLTDEFKTMLNFFGNEEKK